MHGGAAGRPPDRARLGRGRRSAQAPGHGGGGRPGIFATDDSLFDPRGLYLYGGDTESVERAEGAGKAQGTVPRDAGGRLTHEYRMRNHRVDRRKRLSHVAVQRLASWWGRRFRLPTDFFKPSQGAVGGKGFPRIG